MYASTYKEYWRIVKTAKEFFMECVMKNDKSISVDRFSPEVQEALGYYVYRLIDPRNGNTFYAGKGKGNRVFAHTKDSLQPFKKNGADDTGEMRNEDEDDLSLKIKTIREIHAEGLDVLHIIHRHGMDEDTAFAVEAALIDAYPGLANIVGGHGSADYGPMNVFQIVKTYGLPVISSFDDRCLIIKIRQETVGACGSVYEAVRSTWHLNKARAEQAQYVLAAAGGVVTGVFTADLWYETSAENTAVHGGAVCPGRYAFCGKEADEAAKNRYLNKRIPDTYRGKHAANPIRFTY
jgi:hypothetical protein